MSEEQPEVVVPFDHLKESKRALSFIRDNFEEMPDDAVGMFVGLSAANALVSIAESLHKLVNPAPLALASPITPTPAYL